MTSVPLREYRYDLPNERIARFPLPERDQSKLLVSRPSGITHRTFTDLPGELPERSLLVFNDTKVIPARLRFRRATGALIELFLLHPVEPTPVLAEAMSVTGTCVWECLIGNRKRWKAGEGLSFELRMKNEELRIQAERVDSEKSHVRFSWYCTNPAGSEPPSNHRSETFLELLRAAGALPLPPYLNREAQDSDYETYQTVYSRHAGAVAAPTAGLHFTDRVFEDLKSRGHQTEFLTLHVGAGTFQPVKVENVLEHPMHGEQVVVTRRNVEVLLENLGRIIPVGTTSMRALETMYWLGTQTLQREILRVDYASAAASPRSGSGMSQPVPFFIDQHEPYLDRPVPPPREALEALLRHFDRTGTDVWTGETRILIVPGYDFKLCRGLVTNFHQPGSTLLVLIAALIGERWREVYAQALQNGYRFLSYGDSSLLMP
jgi:S-adenosylmethionine:tRNA ribosyltransferase-isomerase